LHARVRRLQWVNPVVDHISIVHVNVQVDRVVAYAPWAFRSPD
jgi:hypothetical protein